MFVSGIFSPHVDFGPSMTFSIFHELSEKFHSNVSCFDTLITKWSLGFLLHPASTIQINTKIGWNLISGSPVFKWPSHGIWDAASQTWWEGNPPERKTSQLAHRICFPWTFSNPRFSRFQHPKVYSFPREMIKTIQYPKLCCLREPSLMPRTLSNFKVFLPQQHVLASRRAPISFHCVRTTIFKGRGEYKSDRHTRSPEEISTSHYFRITETAPD